MPESLELDVELASAAVSVEVSHEGVASNTEASDVVPAADNPLRRYHDGDAGVDA